MRLFRFINESPLPLNKSKESIPSIIRKDCRQYMRLIKPLGMPFMRGFGHQFLKSAPMKGSWLYWGKTRQKRKPSIYEQMSIWISRYLQENGHHSRVKNALICTSEKERASDFGEMFYVFPIKMKGFTFIRSRDFHFDSKHWEPYSVENIIYKLKAQVDSGMIDSNHLLAELTGFLDREFPNAFVSDRNVKEAYNNNYEIWFECDSYYVMDSDLKYFIKEEIMI